MGLTTTRKALLAGWLVLPLCGWAFHEGPGQDLEQLDEVDDLLDDARADVESERYADAVGAFDAALKQLPKERVAEARRIRLERAKAQMFASGLPVAHAELRKLVDELLEIVAPVDDGDIAIVAESAAKASATEADVLLLDEASAAFANAQYYMTWLMRLEGQPRDKWEPEIDAARQTYRLLAERADARGDVALATRHREDAESAIRLARLEIKDLQGLPLPGQ